jgi:hypothetical protein
MSLDWRIKALTISIIKERYVAFPIILLLSNIHLVGFILSHIFLVTLIFFLCLKDSFNRFFYSVGLITMNLFSFCLLWKDFISPLIMNSSIGEYSNLGWQLLTFQDLYFSMSSLLFRASHEIYAFVMMDFSFDVICCFSLAAFDILSFSVYLGV